MRNGFKRLTAALLLICTLASFLVPATFAENEEVVQTYDFVIYDKNNDKGYNALTGGVTKKWGTNKCACGCDKLFKDHLAELYGQLGWTIFASNISNLDNIAFRSDAGWGLRAKGKNCWVALKINVAKAGTYKVNYTACIDSEHSVEAYAFTKDELGSGTVAELMESSTASEHCLGEVTTNSANKSSEFENACYFAAGENIVVIYLKSSTIGIGKLELLASGEGETPAPSTTQAPTTEEPTTTEPSTPDGIDTTTPGAVVRSYNFTLVPAMGGTRTTLGFNKDCQCGCGKKLAKHLEELNVGWEYLEDTASGDPLFASSINWSFRLEDSANSGMLYVKIDVPAEGTFDLRYNSASGSDTAYNYSASLLTLEEYENGAAGTSIGSISIDKDKMTDTFGTCSFPEKGEYVLALKLEDTNRFYIQSLELVVPGEVEDPTDAPTEEPTTTEPSVPSDIDTTTPGAVVKFYDFTIDAAMGGERASLGFGNDCQCGCGKKLRDHLKAHYGEYGWEYLYDNASGSPIFRKDIGWGFRLDDDAKSGALFLKIDVPAAGTFNLRYTSASGPSTAHNYSAYLMTMDEYTNGTTRTVEECKVGSISINKNKLTGTFGSCTFPEKGEYALVLMLDNAERFYIQSLELVVPGAEEPEETLPETEPTIALPTECTGTYKEGVYNFALYEEDARKYLCTDGVKLIYKDLSKACPVCGEKLRDCIAAQFAENELNWKMEKTTFASVAMMADDGQGFRTRYMYGEDGKTLMDENGKEVEQTGNWIAFRVKVNATGKQRITVTKTAAFSYTANMYIFPAAAEAMTEEQITAQMTDGNLAGEVTFDKVMTQLRIGEKNFETAGEYIIALKTTGTAKRIYLNSIIIEEPTEDPDIPAVDKKVYNFDLSKDDPLLDSL